MHRLAEVGILGLLIALTACASSSGEDCGGRSPGVLATTTYSSAGNAGPDARFPHGPEPKTITIDRATGSVEIRYTRGGVAVVERWKR